MKLKQTILGLLLLRFKKQIKKQFVSYFELDPILPIKCRTKMPKCDTVLPCSNP